MIVVDTSVWVEHLRRGDPLLVQRLEASEVLGHPLVIGELAMGNLPQRKTTLSDLRALPRAVVASDDEVMAYIEREALHGLGIGYMDAHLLAATRLSSDARLWTRDRRLGDLAARVGLAAAND